MRLWRALALGLVLAPANAYWVIHMERVRAGPYVTSISLFANCVFLLAGLVAVNWLLRRRWPRVALSAGELLLIYSMCCLGSAAAGIDFVQVLMMILSHPRQFATPENNYELFLPHLPRWFIVQDIDAVKRYHAGHSSFWLPENYKPYLVPCTAWLTFTAALLMVMQGVDALLARPWIERERLTFPTLDLPLTLVREKPSYFSSPAFLIGLAIPVIWSGLNGLHFLFPAVPELKVWPGDLVKGNPSKHIRAMVWMPLTFYPFAIGLGYLLPTDLLFSAWFFYLTWKAELGLTSLLALDVNPRMPYTTQQSLGACIGLLSYLAYTSRHYAAEVWEGLFKRGASACHSAEFRGAAAAILVGGAYLTFFSRLAGMSWPMLLLFWALYWVIVITITRMRAELGPPTHDFHQMGPELMLVPSIGSQNIAPRDLGIMSVYWWINRAYRGLPMAHHIEGLKAAWETGVRPGWFHAGMWLAGVSGTAAAMLAYLHLAFKLGAASGFHSGTGYGWANYGQLVSWLTQPKAPDHSATAAIGVGLGFSLFLLSMRLRFLGWPFHPIGFAIAGSWAINLVWLPLLIAWGLKVSIIRWGGLRLYVRCRPFFLGLILGDCLMGSFWALVGVVLGIPTYSFWGA
ncbi:MAG: hypothetical protein HUU35_11350 [Armatimonadetes bacterium]|nr:hypothetical protein [Armatimonadota bacterium]